MNILKKILAIFLRFGISVLLLIFLFRKVDLSAILVIVKNAQHLLLFVAFLVSTLCYVLAFIRWYMLLKAVKIDLSLNKAISSYSGGLFFNLFLPSTIGGDIVRSVDLSKHTRKPKEVIATVFLDRLSGYVGLVILAVTALLIGWDLVQIRAVLVSVIIITLILIAVLVVIFNTFVYKKLNSLLYSSKAGKIRELITSLHEEIHLYRGRKKVLINNVLLSVLIQVLSPLSFYIIALSLGLNQSLIYFMIFFPVIGAITLLPISIGGLGLRDATTVFFFSRIGVPKDLSFAMSLSGFFFILVVGICGGLIYVFTVHNRRVQCHKPSRL